MECGVLSRACERRMDCDGITLRKHLFEGDESGVALLTASRGVVQKHTEAHASSPVGHYAPDISCAHDTQCVARSHSKTQQRRPYILRHPGGIAAGSVRHTDARLPTVVKIYMVHTDGGGGYDFHPRAFQKTAVTFRPGTDYEGIGVFYILSRKLFSAEFSHTAPRIQSPVKIRDGGIHGHKRFFHLVTHKGLG